jgi:hypothetical protein
MANRGSEPPRPAPCRVRVHRERSFVLAPKLLRVSVSHARVHEISCALMGYDGTAALFAHSWTYPSHVWGSPHYPTVKAAPAYLGSRVPELWRRHKMGFTG